MSDLSDLGDLGRELSRRAKEVTDQAVSALTRIVSRHDDDATPEEVSAEAGLIQRFIVAHQPPPGPIRERWSLGIGDLLLADPRLPDTVQQVADRLNWFGGVEITPETVAFDGDKVEWASVAEVRTRSLIDYLASDAVDRQLDHLPIPWFPGRARLIHVFSDAVMSLLLTTAREHVERGNDIRIPAEISFRDGGRHHEIAPGMLAALIVADPAVMSCLITTAATNRIMIRPADDGLTTTESERLNRLMARIDALEIQLVRQGAVVTEPNRAARPRNDGSGEVT